MDLREYRTKEILKNEEFKESVLGIHISKNGITFSLHSAHLDDSNEYIQTEDGEFSKEEILAKIRAFDSMISSLKPSITIVSTAISLPGPVENEAVVITNFWSSGDNRFSLSEFSEFRCCHTKQLCMINEIQALGYGIISTDEFYGLEDDFVPLWKPPAMDVMPVLYPLYFSSEAAVVLQISRGLGAAFIIPIDSTDSYNVISSEWGHSLLQICGPEETNYEEELELMNFIREKKGAAVEWEDICSYRGLQKCYEFELLKRMKESSHQSSLSNPNLKHEKVDLSNLDPIDLIEKDSNDVIASKALENHFKFVMRFARTCAIGFKCKSIFITYTVFNDGFKCLKKNLGMCRDEFMHFTKSEWVSNVPVFVQNSNRNISAMGVLFHAFNEISKKENKTTNSINEIEKIEIESTH